MHPVLSDRKRLALYLLTWAVIGALLARLAVEPGRVDFRTALLLTLPPAIVYAFICLSAWYPVRALPLRRVGAWSMLFAHSLAAVIFGLVWLVMTQAWGWLVFDIPARRADLYFITGVLLYLLAIAFHYLLAGLEEARQLEQREISVKLLAREAELKVLKAQLDPHFLFNSLNSISALCGSSPGSARTLTTLLAEYLRKSLRVGSAETITLSEELELASSYLAIERIRFGPRLEFVQEIDESVRDVRVPPLLLQPLVENAVTHGVGQLIEGGTVQIAAGRNGAHVWIRVENRCDPDRASKPGSGIGLTNTRKRVETFYGPAARMNVVEEPERFRVDIVIPSREDGEESPAEAR